MSATDVKKAAEANKTNVDQLTSRLEVVKKQIQSQQEFNKEFLGVIQKVRKDAESKAGVDRVATSRVIQAKEKELEQIEAAILAVETTVQRQKTALKLERDQLASGSAAVKSLNAALLTGIDKIST